MSPAASRVSGRVTLMRDRMRPATGTSYWMDRPRSPRAARPIHSRYCTANGRSSPIDALSRATASGLPSVPRMIIAASPGRIRITTNTRTETKKRVTASATTLRAMYRRN